MKKKITIDAKQMHRLAMTVNQRSDSPVNDRELDAQEDALSRKVMVMLERNQVNMDNPNDGDKSQDEKNIDANWQAIKQRIEQLEKAAGNGGEPGQKAEVRSLEQARSKKKSFLPVSLVAMVAAAAAIVLYVMPATQQTNDDRFNIKGTGGSAVTVCNIELRSGEQTHVLGDQPTIINSAEKFALVARCSESQFLHVKISSQDLEEAMIRNRQITNSESQIILPATTDGGLLEFAPGGSYSIVVASTASELEDQDQIFANPELSSNWRQSFVVTAE